MFRYQPLRRKQVRRHLCVSDLSSYRARLVGGHVMHWLHLATHCPAKLQGANVAMSIAEREVASGSEILVDL